MATGRADSETDDEDDFQSAKHDFDAYDATLYPVSKAEASSSSSTSRRTNKVFDPFLDDPERFSDGGERVEESDDEDPVPPPTSLKILLTDQEALDHLEAIRSARERANEQFKWGKVQVAKECYKDCLDELPRPQDVQNVTDETKGRLKKERAILWANMAACTLKLEPVDAKEAALECDRALKEDGLYVKALHRRIMANELVNSWSSLTTAQKDLETLAGIVGSQTAALQPWIRSAEQRLPGRVKAAQEKEQAEMLAKLKDLGNSVLGRFGLSTDMFKMQKDANGGYKMEMNGGK